MRSPKRTKISKKENGGGFGATTHFWTFFLYHQSVYLRVIPFFVGRFLLVKIPFGQVPHLLCFLPRKLDHQLTNPEKKNTEISGFSWVPSENIRKIIRMCQKVKWKQWKPSIKSLEKLCQGTSRGSPAAMADLPLSLWPPRLEAMAPQWAPPALPWIAWPPRAKLPPPGVSWISGFLDALFQNHRHPQTMVILFKNIFKKRHKMIQQDHIKMGLIVIYWCDSCL